MKQKFRTKEEQGQRNFSALHVKKAEKNFSENDKTSRREQENISKTSIVRNNSLQRDMWNVQCDSVSMYTIWVMQ